VHQLQGWWEKLQKSFSLKTMTPANQVTDEEVFGQLEVITLGLERALARYQMTSLTTYKHGENWFSTQLEFYHFLINGEVRRVPVMQQNLQETLLTSRTVFGFEKGELRAASSTYHVATLGVKDYPKPITPGLLSVLLSAPGEFVLTQSFVPLSKTESLNRGETAVERMGQTAGRAVSEVNEMSAGGEGSLLDDLASGRYILGEYSLTVVLKARTVPQLSELIAHTVTTLSEVGFMVAREDFGVEASFWSQLPGQHLRYRARPDTVTSRNAAGLMALYGEYKGDSREKSHWPNSTALFRTLVGSLYELSLHVRDVGHTFICGPTGRGKTTVQLYLAAMQAEANVTQVIFDNGLGTAVYVSAMGGKYHDVRIGSPFANPFQLESNPENIAFVTLLFHRLAKKGGHQLSQREQTQIDSAVKNVFGLPKPMRRAQRLLDFIDKTEKDGLDKKLARYLEGGSMEWLFDNEKDSFDFDRPVTGVNIEHIIDNDEIRAECMMYLFHRVGLIKDGRRLRVDIAEFWRALDDEYFVDWLQAFFNKARKDNAMLVAETQSPEKVANSKIAHVVIGQTATKIYIWNPEASKDVYMNDFGLNATEFAWVKKLGIGRILVKKTDGTSVILELDLGGRTHKVDLAVLSPTTESARGLLALIDKVGDDPKVWGPIWNK
jgi:type IV secretion system protein VirB4